MSSVAQGPADGNADPGSTHNAALLSRPTVIFHEVNTHAFAFAPILRTLVGDRFIRRNVGTAAQPEGGALLASGILQEDQAHRIVLARNAVPVGLALDGTAFRDFFPIAHPVLRCLRRLDQAIRAKAGERGTLLTRGEVARTIATGVVEELPRYPDTDFHVGFLLSGAGLVTPEAAEELAERMLAKVNMGLADFPSIMQAQTAAELIAIGAPLEGSVSLKLNGDTVAVDALKRWQKALPPQVFHRICSYNRADLILFDRVAATLCERLPVVNDERRKVSAAIEALAGVTRHRQGLDPKRRNAKSGPIMPKLLEPDPVLGWRLAAGVSNEVVRQGQSIRFEVDADGCRTVPGQPQTGEKTLAAYGCSFTFGAGLAAEETFCADLQGRLPAWRIENRGVHGYGHIHNLLRLQRDVRWEKADYVTFGWIPEHLLRNVADVQWIQMQRREPVLGSKQPRRMTPRAFLDRNGQLKHRDISFQRMDLAGIDLRDFASEQYYIDDVCFSIIAKAAALVTQSGGHFFVTLLQAKPTPRLSALLAGAGIPVVDASVSGPEYVGLDSFHPSALANKHFAEAIHRYLMEHARAVVK